MTKFHKTDQKYSACREDAVGIKYWQTGTSVNALAFVMEGGLIKMILVGRYRAV